MLRSLNATLLLLALLQGCPGTQPSSPARLKYTAAGTSPQMLATYEAWFGHPRHISVGYSSHDPAVVERQMRDAAARGISAFVVDWYGDREPFIDESYALLQKTAAKQHFHVAMMYDETDHEDDATDEAIADFTMFHDTYLSTRSAGHEAYLTYQGRPVIFIFPKGGHTNWDKVRAVVDRWDHPPLLIDENPQPEYAKALDGFYAWVSPGPKGWAVDGSNWGEDYLADFYKTMTTKYADKIIVGGAWAGFDDRKGASWSLNRHMSSRCGATYTDTLNLWRKYAPAGQVIPFIMVETWNDYEEGTATEPGLPPACK